MTTHSAQVLAFPVTRSERLLSHVTLLTLDGAPFASAGFLPGNPGAAWAWVVQVVAAELECQEEEVGCADGLEGDLVTAEGLPVYMVEIVRPRAFRSG